MLLLGHIFALSPIVEKGILRLLPICKTNARRAALISFTTLMVSWFNWGLGLVFGAIFCKKLLEYAHDKKLPLNAGLNRGSRILWPHGLAWWYFRVIINQNCRTWAFGYAS